MKRKNPDWRENDLPIPRPRKALERVPFRESEPIVFGEPEPGEHNCHVHPLGSFEVKVYWCGHTCLDEGVCRPYMAVWLITHPMQVVRHLRGLDYRGRSR